MHVHICICIAHIQFGTYACINSVYICKCMDMLMLRGSGGEVYRVKRRNPIIHCRIAVARRPHNPCFLSVLKVESEHFCRSMFLHLYKPCSSLKKRNRNIHPVISQGNTINKMVSSMHVSTDHEKKNCESNRNKNENS